MVHWKPHLEFTPNSWASSWKQFNPFGLLESWIGSPVFQYEILNKVTMAKQHLVSDALQVSKGWCWQMPTECREENKGALNMTGSQGLKEVKERSW